MKINLFQIDAFTSTVFKGNPAAVCPLDAWLDDFLSLKLCFRINKPWKLGKSFLKNRRLSIKFLMDFYCDLKSYLEWKIAQIPCGNGQGLKINSLTI